MEKETKENVFWGGILITLILFSENIIINTYQSARIILYLFYIAIIIIMAYKIYIAIKTKQTE